MPRFFDNKKVELLAPAGTFDIFKGIIQAHCDAVYFGGKKFNMRLHRKDYNFSDEEMKEAISIARELDKAVYITVNNLYDVSELGELKEYLLYLNEIKPHALIVQDFAVLKLIKDLNLPLEVHSSVMMNVHNFESIKALRSMGVTRAVMSRESELSYIKALAAKIDMEFEYFVHGDMCICHGGQCLYSGMLFGQSSNRGKCLKPCRWDFKIQQSGKIYNTEFPMAVKDMYMYENIPELIHNHVTSFKIEGRMRDLGYLTKIVDTYGDAIDRYIKDPVCYDRKKEAEFLYENRKRDTSTGFAFGNQGLANINRRYEGTGKFYSTGKVFSTATEEKEITSETIELLRTALEKSNVNNQAEKKISVKVDTVEQAEVCLVLAVDAIYLSGDVFKPNKAFSKEEILALTAKKGNTEIYLALPHMTFDVDIEEYSQLLQTELNIDGLLVTNLGAVAKFKQFNLMGDYPLNLLNEKSWEFYKELGLKQFTISPEATITELRNLLEKVGEQVELIVHGSPVVMYLEHDLYENVNDSGDVLYLIDEKNNKRPVYRDKNNRNHVLLSKQLCYLPLLKSLYDAGLSNFRIEANYMNAEELKSIIQLYQEAIRDLESCQTLMVSEGSTLGAFEFVNPLA